MNIELLSKLEILLEWMLDSVNLEHPADQFLATEAHICIREVRMEKEFKSFWFEGRKFSGMVKNPQTLGKLKKAYPDYLKARKKDESFDPMFSFDAMYRGITLEEYLK